MVLGDFSNILNQDEKLGGRHAASFSNSGFGGFVNEIGLIDLGYLGHTFTWNNKKIKKQKKRRQIQYLRKA